jgi:HTH-type transcriptional regulator, sugar sensing transcriptional regulator
MSMNEKLLEQIGMTKSEIKVYLALLELGCCATGKIVEKSGASSSKIYEVLEKLMQKGLVSFIVKSGVKHFEAAPPSRIMEYMKEKEQAIFKQKEELKTILPQLELKQQLSKYKSEATIFKGIKGAETAFRQMISRMHKGDEWLAFVVHYIDKKYYSMLTRIHKLRLERKLNARIIFNTNDINFGDDRKRMPFTAVKYVSESLNMPAIVNVGGNITLLNIMADDVTVFMIDSKEVADSFRSQFEGLWNEEVNVYKGVDDVTSFLDVMLNSLKKGDEYYVLNGNIGLKTMPVVKDFFNEYHKKRVKKGINLKMLYNYNIKDKINEMVCPPAKLKMLPSEFKSPLQVFFYKDKTYMTLWEKNPLGILINNKNVTDGFRTYFDSLWNQDSRIIKGMDGVKQIFEEMLEHGSCDYIAARGYFIERASETYINDWERRAKEKKFVMRNIVDPSVKGHKITNFPFAKTKYTLPKEFANLSVFWIYGGKVAISNWADEEPIIMIVENKSLYDMYKQQFELLWNQDVFAQKGMDNVYHAWNNMIDELSPGDEYYVLSASWHGQTKQMKNFFRDFHMKRVNKGINVKFIFSSELRSLIENNKDLYHNKSIVRYYDSMMYNEMQINLYRNKVLMFIWREKDPIIITIEDKNVFNGFKMYFDMMWNISKS